MAGWGSEKGKWGKPVKVSSWLDYPMHCGGILKDPVEDTAIILSIYGDARQLGYLAFGSHYSLAEGGSCSPGAFNTQPVPLPLPNSPVQPKGTPWATGYLLVEKHRKPWGLWKLSAENLLGGPGEMAPGPFL